MTIENNKKFYTAKYDRVFKTIICNEDNVNLLKAILKQILKIEVEDVKILRSELPVKNIIEREKTVDLLVKSNDNIYTHVELNTNYNSSIKLRNLIYFMDIICSKTKRGESFNIKNNFIHVDLNYIEGKRKLKEAKGDEISEYWLQTNEGYKYTDKIKMLVYNIAKDSKFWYDERGKVKEEYKYLLMLDMKIEELREIEEGDEIIMEYKNKLNDLNEDEEFQAFMTVEEDREMMLKSFYEEGLEEGILKKQREMIINLQELNIPIEQIAQASKLTIEEVTKIINEQGN